MNSPNRQSVHGGKIREAAKRQNVAPESFLDFSSNLNVFIPEIEPVRWNGWRTEISVYPEAGGEEISRRLGPLLGLPGDFLIPTSGGIEAIYLAARLFSKKRVVVLEPSFSDYARAFTAAGAEVIRSVAAPVEKAPLLGEALENAEVIVFGNPNNPTGRSYSRVDPAMDSAALEDAQSWVVDEAFVEFSGKPEETTLLPALSQNENIIVVGSLTKSWRIPGLRLGYLATSHPGWKKGVEGMQPPWSLNAVAQAWAREMLVEAEAIKVRESLRDVSSYRKAFQNQMESETPFQTIGSDANFFLAQYQREDGRLPEIIRGLEQKGILVRDCNSFEGMPKDRWIRLAVRRPDENQKLVRVLACISTPSVR